MVPYRDEWLRYCESPRVNCTNLWVSAVNSRSCWEHALVKKESDSLIKVTQRAGRGETKEGTKEWMTAPRKEIRKHFLCSRGEKTKECYSLLYHLILVILNVVLRRVALIPYLRIRFVSSILSHAQNKRSRWDTIQELDDRAHRIGMSQQYKNRGGCFVRELAENLF